MSHAKNDDALRCALENLATRLLEARVQHGMSRRELARQMGYSNLDVGCARIADWECGQTKPDREQIPELAEALELADDNLRVWVDEVDFARTRLATKRRLVATMMDSASRRDQTLVARHFDDLLQHMPQILAWPSWRDIRVGASRVELTFTGGFTPTLGMYLANWNEHHFTVGDVQGQPRHYILEVTGSPLSNRHALTGFELTNPQILYGLRHDRATLLEFVAPLFRTRRTWAEPTLTPWSVGQLLARLGASIKDICVLDLDGSAIGFYSHRDAAIWLTYQGNVFERTFAEMLSTSEGWKTDATLDWPKRPERAVGTEAFGLVVKREALMLPSVSGGIWSAYPGVLLDQQGEPVLMFDGVLPLPVLEALVAWLSEVMQPRVREDFTASQPSL